MECGIYPAGHRDIAQVHCRRVLAFAHGAGKSDMSGGSHFKPWIPWIFVADGTWLKAMAA